MIKTIFVSASLLLAAPALASQASVLEDDTDQPRYNVLHQEEILMPMGESEWEIELEDIEVSLL